MQIGYLVTLGDNSLDTNDYISASQSTFTIDQNIGSGSWNWTGIWADDGQLYSNINDAGTYYSGSDGNVYFVPGIHYPSSGHAFVTAAPAYEAPDGIVKGTEGDDIIDTSFTDGDGDSVDAGDGTGALRQEDTISAGSGNDSVAAGLEDDLVYGGGGADTLHGDAGNDTIYGDSDPNVTVPTLSDGSFENFDPTFYSQANSLPDWYTWNGSTPDLNDEAGYETPWHGYQSPTDGTNYVGLVADGSTWKEGLSQDLNDPLIAGGTYSITINAASGVIDGAAYNQTANVVLEIWGNPTSGATAGSTNGIPAGHQLLGTATITSMTMTTYTISFTPTTDINTLTLSVESLGPPGTYHSVMFDNVSLNVDSIPGGDPADDSIFGGDGDDLIFGEGGDDTIEGGTGVDSMDGGDGIDEATYENSNTGVNANLATGGTSNDADGDTYTNIENLTGTAFADNLTGDANANVISAGDGFDVVDGGMGDDTIYGGEGSNVLEGGAGDDLVYGGSDTDYVYLDGGADTVFTGGGLDYVLVRDGFGDHDIDGGSAAGTGFGGDQLTFRYYTGDIDITVTGTGTGTATDGVNTITYSDIENIRLGTGDDTIDATGSSAEVFAWDGSGGDNLIAGGSGNLAYYDSTGNSTVFGGSGDDYLSMNGGDDLVVLSDGFGNDTIIGGETGETNGDTLDTSSLTTGVNVTFTSADGEDGTAVVGGDMATFEEIENVIFTDQDDIIDASVTTGGMDIDAAGGNDSVIGGSGNDSITGGTGDDILTGGTGNDSFSYTASDGNDTITDFNVGNSGTFDDGSASNNDSINLSAFYDNIWELHADQADDGILNQSNNSVDGVDYSDNTSFGSGSITFTGATGDNTFFTHENTGVVCFTSGTAIRTPRGDVLIDDLDVGDLVTTMDNGPQRIRWIGKRSLGHAELIASENLRPILITRGVLGAERDLLVSPQHGMLIGKDHLARANHILHLSGVRIAHGKREVTYYHLMFESHQIIFAENAPAESFYPGPMGLGMMDDNTRCEMFTLFPELKSVGQRRDAVLDAYGLTARQFIPKRELSRKHHAAA